jgi:hypothetical protein
MRKSILLAAAMAVVAVPSMTLAAEKGKKPAPAPAPAAANAEEGGSQEDIERGVVIIRSFNGALASEQLSKEQKGAMIACLYNNPVRKISVATGKVLGENPKLDPKNPNHIYAAAAAVCAVPKGEAPAAAPAKPSDQKGR